MEDITPLLFSLFVSVALVVGYYMGKAQGLKEGKPRAYRVRGFRVLSLPEALMKVIIDPDEDGSIWFSILWAGGRVTVHFKPEEFESLRAFLNGELEEVTAEGGKEG